MKLILKLMVFILNLIYIPFKLLPVQDKVTFISRQSNVKTEDIEMLGSELEARGIDVRYLCMKMEKNPLKLIAYCFHIFSQMYHIATSKVVILDSYCICVSVLKQRPSLTVIQMWHALGSLKKFGLSIVGDGEGSSKAMADAMKMHRNYSYVLTSGQACLPNFAEAFGYSDELEKMKVMSLPRVDKLTDPKFRQDSLDRIFEKYPWMKDKKVVVYAPTFRKGRDISARIDALAEKFDPDEYVFILKKHPHMEANCRCAFVEEKFTTLEMLFAADYVICDYSAVIYEAAILKKPMFFYTFEYESYVVDRDFYIDYMEEMPGVIAADPQVLRDAIADRQFDLEAVEAFSHKYIENQKDCTLRLADFVVKCLS